MKWLERAFRWFGFERRAISYTISYHTDSSDTHTEFREVELRPSISVEEVLTWRKRLGWSRRKLARKSGLSVSMIGRIERDWQNVSLSFLTGLAKAYGLSINAPILKPIEQL
jgi:ribosome-binding protein aMBF1 (putative translation factor)